MPAHPPARRISPSPLRHLAAEAPALALDLAGMELLIHAGWDVHLARALSVLVATVAAYFLHQYFTYAGFRGAKTVHGQPLPFGALQAAAGVLSYGIFLRVIYSLPHPVGIAGRFFALLIGAGAGLFFNYAMVHRLLPARTQEAAPAAWKNPVTTKGFRRVLLWLVVACLMLQSVRTHHQNVMSWPGLADPLGPYDPDVWVRLTQVRQWVAGGLAGFYDHAVRNVNAPFGGIATPWTRPLDIILSVFYFFTPHNLATNLRLMLAATWMPPFIGLGAIMLLTLAVRRQFNNLHALGFVALLVLFSPDTYYYYTPGDSDHHGLLSMLWCGVLAMLMRRDYSPCASVLCGGLLGLMIWISPEALILTAAVYGLLCAVALWSPSRADGLSFTALGAAAIATVGLFIEVPPDKIFTQLTYDSLSIVQIALLWLSALAAAALAMLCRKKTSFGLRFFSAAVAGSFVILGMKLLYPRFFLGPLADVDPFILTSFLPRVGEAKPLLKSTWDDVVRELMEPALAAVLMVVSLRRHYLRPERRRRLLMLAALLAVTLVMTLWQIRWSYYLHPVAIVAIGMSVAGVTAMQKTRPWVWLRHLPRPGRPYIILWLAFFSMNFFGRLNPSGATEALSCMSQVRYVIQTQQLQSLLGNKDLVLFAPEDAGGDALFFTPYRIIASNYHREGAGLRDMTLIYTAKTPEQARPLLEKRSVDALLYCPGLWKNGWLETPLTDAKKRPRWLVPVNGLRFVEEKEKPKQTAEEKPQDKAKGKIKAKTPVLFRIERLK